MKSSLFTLCSSHGLCGCRGILVTRSILKNNSLYVLDPRLGEHDGHYQCESKVYYVQLYGTDLSCYLRRKTTSSFLDRPSAIQARIHYATSDEIGLKFQYPFDIIESLMITYQTRSNGVVHKLRLAPPLSNVRLSNLSCGNIYEIIIYAQNQAGSSAREYLIGKTDGSGKYRSTSNSKFIVVGSSSIARTDQPTSNGLRSFHYSQYDALDPWSMLNPFLRSRSTQIPSMTNLSMIDSLSLSFRYFHRIMPVNRIFIATFHLLILRPTSVSMICRPIAIINCTWKWIVKLERFWRSFPFELTMISSGRMRRETMHTWW